MSYTLNYRGAKIDELLGQVDEQFIAEYNVALYADITAAIAAGKQVLLKKDNALYPYIGTDASSSYTFAMVDEDAILQLFTVSTASVWATVSKALQEELTFDAAPTDGSTKPVTSDGIYDAIEEAKAEAQEQSYDLLVTDTAQGAIATFPDGADNVPVKSLIAQITPVQAGSGDPAPDNIRPISGWTGAKINVDGVNVWDEEWELGSLNSNTGAEVSSTTAIRNKGYITALPETDYFFKIGVSSIGMNIMFYDVNKVFFSRIAGDTLNNAVFTTPQNTAFMRFNLASTYGTTYNNDISINYPSTDTTYHAYTGNTINVDWTDEAGTVYGGTLTYMGGGKYSLQATKGYAVYDGSSDETWAFASGSRQYAVGKLPFEVKYTNTGETLPAISNIAVPVNQTVSYASITYAAIGGNTSNRTDIRFIYAGVTDVGTIDDFCTWLSNNNLIVAYDLYTLPDPIILDAEDVKTLLGDNNIFVDTGDVDVTYRADTALYIDKKLGQ